jgi:hypothetical protein
VITTATVKPGWRRNWRTANLIIAILSPEPFIQRDTAASDNGADGTDGERPATVLGDNDLFPGHRISPFLMAPRLPDQNEVVMPQNRGDLAGRKTGCSPITQP